MGAEDRTSRCENPLRHISLADCVTLGNGVCGLLVVAAALGGTGTHFTHGRLILCAALIGLGSIFDVLDGLVARRRGSSGMGDALDLMCDTLTFGVGPAAILIASSAGHSGAWRVAVLPVASLLVVASMLRLARYQTFPAPPDGGFYGLTMPAAASVVLALLFLNPAPILLLIGVLGVCGMMMSQVRYPRQDKRWAPVLCAYWLAGAAVLAGLAPAGPVAVAYLVGVPGIPLAAGGVHRLAWRRAMQATAGTNAPEPVNAPASGRLAAL